MNTTFENDLQIGKQGESLLAAALLRRGHKIEDLSDCRTYQRKDIDMRLTKDGVSVTLEVKNDRKSEYTGNVFVEIKNRNNTSRNCDGWLCYCEADYIAFV